MWKTLILLLSLNSFASMVDGERLALKMCNIYQNVPIERNYILPLPMHATPIDVTFTNCTNTVQLIAGGEPARYGEFPHHALLGYNKKGTDHEYEFRCGGTLISDRHVLTAARCFAMEYPSIVRLGVYDILMDHGHEVPIEGFLRHPEHSYFRAYHDIALVKLEHRVYFTSNIRPACLWYTESRNTTKFIVTGFDNNNSYGVPSTQLTKVVLEEFPGQDCAQRYKFLPRFSRGITDGQLCVGSDLEGRHACIGDPGSSLLTLTHPKTCMFHIVGITPIGPYGCGVGKTRALYTKVAHYLDWIEENVWGSKANLADTYKFNKFF